MKKLMLMLVIGLVSAVMTFPVFAAKLLDDGEFKRCVNLSDGVDSSYRTVKRIDSKLDSVDRSLSGIKLQLVVSRSAVMMAKSNANWSGNWNQYNYAVNTHNANVAREGQLVDRFNRINRKRDREIDNQRSIVKKYNRQCVSVSAKESTIDAHCGSSSTKFCSGFNR